MREFISGHPSIIPDEGILPSETTLKRRETGHYFRTAEGMKGIVGKDTPVGSDVKPDLLAADETQGDQPRVLREAVIISQHASGQSSQDYQAA